MKQSDTMEVWQEENKEKNIYIVYVKIKNKIYKTTYNLNGLKLTEEYVHCNCPGCKHFISCSFDRTHKANQLGGCGKFEKM